MNKVKKVFNAILMSIFAPFVLLFQPNAIPNPNKKVRGWMILLISLAVVGLIIFFYYFAEEVFKW